VEELVEHKQIRVVILRAENFGDESASFLEDLSS